MKNVEYLLKKYKVCVRIIFMAVKVSERLLMAAK